MKVLIAAAALSLVLAAAPVHAQTPAGQTPQPQQPQQPAPQPPRPFPEGSKIAFINIQRIANDSAEGKASTAKVKALNDKKVAELAEKQKALQAAQQKLQKEASVLSESAAAQLQKDIERQEKEIQRFTQDAQTEVQELQQELQIEFQRKLMPVIQQVATEKSLHMIFSQADAGIIWADLGLDITADVIKRFDSGGSAKPGASAQKPPLD
jgi:outer membrane protein